MDFTLYAVTDRLSHKNHDFYEAVENALQGGVTILQIREKGLDYESLLSEAIKVKKIAKKYNVPLIIDDNADAALGCKADGVHLGQKDMPIAKARQILGEKAIIGKTVKTLTQAIEAERDGADYLGVGAAFPTNTKRDTYVISHEVYHRITETVKIPVVAIGGINENNALQLCNTGISGIAVSSAIFGRQDVKQAARQLREISERISVKCKKY